MLNNNLFLTRNEKRVLKLLLENARIPDSTMANILKISNQAIGKIRRKLERTVIDSYSVNLNFEKLGIHTFAISRPKLTQEGRDLSPIEIEQKLLNETHIIQLYRLPTDDESYALFWAFRDIDELDNFFHSQTKNKELLRYMENNKLHIFSNRSILKNNPIRLFNKAIDNLETGFSKEGFKEDNTIKKWD